MSVIPIRSDMDSAQLAKVKEVTPLRTFIAQNDDEDKPASLEYNSLSDSLYCNKCRDVDNCTHTARVRLCGIITGTITKAPRTAKRTR